MMNNILEKQISWTSSGGDCKKLEVDDLCVRWYIKSKSLTINGEGSEGLKSKLRSIIYLMDSDPAMSQEVGEKDDEPELESELLWSSSKSSAAQDPALPGLVLEQIHSLEERLEFKIEKLESQIQDLSLASSRQVIHERNDASQSEYNAFLKNENTLLKKENLKFAEQVSGYKMIVSDLNARIRDLENEKNSLVTSIKLLQEDHKIEENRTFKVVRRQKAINNSREKACTDNHFEIQTKNRFSVLSDIASSDNNDVKENSTSLKRPDSGERQVMANKEKQANKDSQTTDGRLVEIFVIGDSIIKHIDPKKLTKRKVNKYTYPRKTAEDIEAELE